MTELLIPQQLTEALTMNVGTLERLVALSETHGPWMVVVLIIAFLVVRRGFSFSCQVNVGQKPKA